MYIPTYFLGTFPERTSKFVKHRLQGSKSIAKINYCTFQSSVMKNKGIYIAPYFFDPCGSYWCTFSTYFLHTKQTVKVK